MRGHVSRGLLIAMLMVAAAQHASTQGPSATLNDGLVAYYPFNAGAIDASGNGNNGVVSGAVAAPDRFGRLASSFAFNGISDYMSVPDSATLDITSTISVSAWIKLDRSYSGGIVYIADKYWDASDPLDRYGWIVSIENSKVRYFNSYSRVGDHYDLLRSDTTLATEVWYHVVVETDNSTLRIFIDGVEHGSMEKTGTLGWSPQSLSIGRSYAQNAYFPGLIDDLRIYDRALSADEVRGLWALESVPSVLTANPGPPQTVQASGPAGAIVTLDGSASFDPAGGTLMYTWTGPFPEGGGTVTGVNPAVTLPVGFNAIVLTVTDGLGGSATATVTIAVPGLPPTPAEVGGRIVFISDRSGASNLYIQDLRTSHVNALTHFPDSTGLSLPWAPRWSVNGTQVAFSATVSGTSQLFLMNDDGTGLQQLTFFSDGTYADYPTWSPTDPDAIFYIHYVPARSGVVNRLDLTTLNSAAIPNSSGVTTQVFDVTTDGAAILFSREPGCCNTGSMASGYQDLQGNPVPVPDPTAPSGSVRNEVGWSGYATWVGRINRVDGWIVYRRAQGANPYGPYDIYKIDKDLTTPTRLTNTSFDVDFPVWAGGDHSGYVIFSANPGGHYEIFAMKADALPIAYPNGVVNLTNNPAMDRMGDWTAVGPAPTANAGPDQLVEASGPSGASVTLDGAGSSDPWGETLSYTWTGPFSEGGGTATGVSPTVTLPGAVSSVTLTVTNEQGRSATGMVTITVRDTAPPALALPSNLAKEATSSQGAVVTYAASATDLVDGPVHVTCSPASGTTFAAGSTNVACSATDHAGNSASGQFTVTVRDTTPPVVHCASPGALWHGSDVVVSCSATDSGSGLANGSDVAFTVATNVPAGAETVNASTGTRSVCDVARNCTIVGPFTGIKVDKSAPAITISSPVTGTVVLHQSVAAIFSCFDAGSGVASCVGTAANGSSVDTATPGPKTFTVTATDRVGNLSTQSVAYSVTYNIGVLYDQGKAKQSGSTIPIKIQLVDAAGVDVSASDVVVTAVGISLISNVALGPVDDSGNANPDGNFRFVGDSYIFNLKTTGLGTGTYALYFRCGTDPTLHTVQFQIK